MEFSLDPANQKRFPVFTPIRERNDLIIALNEFGVQGVRCAQKIKQIDIDKK